MERPQNIGIKAVELYFPSQCVEQSELEKFDGVSQGKYTIGLGQTKMSFCDDREDIYSIALTTVSSLFRKYNIDPRSIGRMEVGTETILDKSKSVKSVLMQLFEESGNTNVEGVDTINACYGGTNALFNTINWIESSAWDGRDAVVVAGDIALYKKGNARPTGGVGCVAMVVGPNAPLVFEPGMRGSYITHTYDFFKADLTSEYPIVDGQYSLRCYSTALDKCYGEYNLRQKQFAARANGTNGHTNGTNGTNGYTNGHTNGHTNGTNGHTNGTNGHANGTNGTNGVNGTHAALESPIDRFDYMCFHSPTCKTVQKSYARLMYNDFLANPENPIFADVPAELKSLDYQASLTDKTLEKTFQAISKKRFAARVQPSIQVATMCGNMYCASVYGALVSLLSNVSSQDLQGKRVAFFSYGSGLASSFFSLKVKGDTSDIAAKIDLHQRLDARRIVSPEVYDEMCNLREHAHLKKSYNPTGDVGTIAPNTYYLTGIDDMFRRHYAVQQ